MQNVTDAMQKHGIKKAAVQKALDSLCEMGDGGPKGPIIFKDYGKQRIYMARQDSLQVLSTEQLDECRCRISRLQEEAVQLRERCGSLEKGILKGPSPSVFSRVKGTTHAGCVAFRLFLLQIVPVGRAARIFCHSSVPYQRVSIHLKEDHEIIPMQLSDKFSCCC